MEKVLSINEILEASYPLFERYNVNRAWIFGSYSRGEATETSDVDILIEGGTFMGIYDFSGFFEELQKALNKDIDIVTLETLMRPLDFVEGDSFFKQNIDKEKRMIYEKVRS